MSGREFGMLGASIWQSRRFRRLGSDSARLAFCYVISTGHGNTIGTYRLNPAYMAADRNISNDQAEADLLDLGHVGLIDYDGQEHVIHIRRWFERNKITNRKHLAGALRFLGLLPNATPLIGYAAADVLLSAYQSSMGWSDLDAVIDMRTMAKNACEKLVIQHDATPYFHEISTSIDIDLSIALSEALSIALPIERERKNRDRIGIGIERGRVREGERKGKGSTAKRPKGKTSAPPEPASAPRRAGPGTARQQEGAALVAMADLVHNVVNGAVMAKVSTLAPTEGQLATLRAKGMITDDDLAAYQRKATR